MTARTFKTGSYYFFRQVWESPYQIDHWETGTWRKLYCGIKIRRDYQYLGYDTDVGYCLDRCNTMQELQDGRYQK